MNTVLGLSCICSVEKFLCLYTKSSTLGFCGENLTVTKSCGIFCSFSIMPTSWSDATDKAPTKNGSGANFHASRTSTYVPPHLRNNPPAADPPSAPISYAGSVFHPVGARKDRNEPAFGEQENTGINFNAYEDIPVETSGMDVPSPVNIFADIDLGEALNLNIRKCKYVKPTPVQRYAIPIALSGRDLMACAQTGSGKTAAFCFPIISGIMKSSQSGLRPPRMPRTAFLFALILSPTRELSMQIHEEARKFAYQTGVKVVVAYGGAPINMQFVAYLLLPTFSCIALLFALLKNSSVILDTCLFWQLRELERGVDILVATPGRLVDVGKSQSLVANDQPQIRRIVQQMDMPPAGVRQTLLFSATFPKEIQRLAADFLSNYVFLAVGRVESSTDLIAQRVEYVLETDKRSHLMDLLHAQRSNGVQAKSMISLFFWPDLQQALTLVFVETKKGADSLEHWLCINGFPATSIHGDRTQQERVYALRSFKTGKTPILVATDVAARGLDILHVGHVINFDLPNDIDDYVHRIGRTGRAGKTGLATAFFNENNSSLARPLADLMQEANQEMPAWLSRFAARSTFGRRGGRFGGRDFFAHSITTVVRVVVMVLR
ncbi:DEAD-box ATP-dependent RNA helicase [Striga asiatica]|uniref:RNA helicase n=1 Tax=Striga asiatica TaxID=4170 RepID=A0A5A7Q7G1_STRAF|nr:DEAD-box ATP-dependent RNA helicase [Striga asiatica]